MHALSFLNLVKFGISNVIQCVMIICVYNNVAHCGLGQFISITHTAHTSDISYSYRPIEIEYRCTVQFELNNITCISNNI